MFPILGLSRTFSKPEFATLSRFGVVFSEFLWKRSFSSSPSDAETECCWVEMCMLPDEWTNGVKSPRIKTRNTTMGSRKVFMLAIAPGLTTSEGPILNDQEMRSRHRELSWKIWKTQKLGVGIWSPIYIDFLQHSSTRFHWTTFHLYGSGVKPQGFSAVKWRFCGILHPKTSSSTRTKWHQGQIAKNKMIKITE